MEGATLSIGEVAAQAEIAVSAIRFYERRGLLPEAEREGGQRRYGTETLARLRAIAVAKRAGFSLAEIGALLGSIDAGAPAHERLRELATSKLPQVEARIAEARAQQDWLRAAESCACTSLDACALFAQP
ncbi:MAG TPA: MerR family transcriptional regulator [Solirubrobacterales bacterium]|nr:MerR family transcriptional regulator [Solirubrobacterales bacterium]